MAVKKAVLFPRSLGQPESIFCLPVSDPRRLFCGAAQRGSHPFEKRWTFMDSAVLAGGRPW